VRSLASGGVRNLTAVPSWFPGSRSGAKAIPNGEEMTLADTVEGFTADLIDEVRFLLVESKVLSSEVIAALHDGHTVDETAAGIRLTDIAGDLGMALSDAIMEKYPQEDDRESIEDECCDAVGYAVIATLESGYWPDFPTGMATLLLSTIHLTRDNPTLQRKIVERYTPLNAVLIEAELSRRQLAEENKTAEEHNERERQQEALKAGEARERQEAKAERERQKKVLKAGQARARQEAKAAAKHERQQEVLKAGHARERQEAKAAAERERQQEVLKAG
jgi:hypothetical protein